ncbi:hypothetical protein RUM43_005416 [Polyplax serrata]|uniref:Uncharacterized protein n=1 Tax=Polyplax serrata TaxID=468196 RepID=A0AAN8PJ23_POLSC
MEKKARNSAKFIMEDDKRYKSKSFQRRRLTNYQKWKETTKRNGIQGGKEGDVKTQMMTDNDGVKWNKNQTDCKFQTVSRENLPACLLACLLLSLYSSFQIVRRS